MKNLTVNLAWKEISGLNRNDWNISKKILEEYLIKRVRRQLQIPIVLKGNSYKLSMGVPLQDVLGFVNSVDLDNRQANISIYKDEFNDIFENKLLGFGLVVELDEDKQVIKLNHITCAYPIEKNNSVWRVNNE